MTVKLGPEAFKFYVSMGPGRSYQGVADHYGVSKRAVTKCAVRENWQGRLDAIEEKARERQDEDLVDVVGESDQDHRQVLLGQLRYPLKFR